MLQVHVLQMYTSTHFKLQILYVKASGENLVPWFDMSGLGNVLHELLTIKKRYKCLQEHSLSPRCGSSSILA